MGEGGGRQGTSAGTTQPREAQVGMWEICKVPALQAPENLEHVYIVHLEKLSWIHCITVVVDAWIKLRSICEHFYLSEQ